MNSIVRNALRELEAFFRRSVEAAQARRQVPAGLDPGATAKGLMSMIVAIRVLGRGTYDEEPRSGRSPPRRCVCWTDSGRSSRWHACAAAPRAKDSMP